MTTKVGSSNKIKFVCSALDMARRPGGEIGMSRERRGCSYQKLHIISQRLQLFFHSFNSRFRA